MISGQSFVKMRVRSKKDKREVAPRRRVRVIAQRPRMSAHIQTMRENLAMDLQAKLEQVNVKATTTEKLGFTGRSEGIAVEAVVLMFGM